MSERKLCAERGVIYQPLDMQALARAAESARKRVAEWPQWKRDLARWVSSRVSTTFDGADS